MLLIRVLSFCILLQQIAYSAFEDHEHYIVTSLGNSPKSIIPIGIYSEHEAYKFTFRMLYEDRHSDRSPSSRSVWSRHEEIMADFFADLGKEFFVDEGSYIKEDIPRILYNIGMVFITDTYDTEIAQKWLYRSALYGCTHAQYALGVLWLDQASAKGSGSASYFLAKLFGESFRSSPDKLFRKQNVTEYMKHAISLKYPLAQLENCLKRIEKVESEQYENYEEDDLLLKKLAEDGCAQASLELSTLYKYGEGSAVAMTHPDIKKQLDQNGNQTGFVFHASDSTLIDLTEVLKNPDRATKHGFPVNKDMSKSFLLRAVFLGLYSAKARILEDYPEEIPNFHVADAPTRKSPWLNLIDFIGEVIPEIHDYPQNFCWRIFSHFASSHKEQVFPDRSNNFVIKKGTLLSIFPYILDAPFSHIVKPKIKQHIPLVAPEVDFIFTTSIGSITGEQQDLIICSIRRYIEGLLLELQKDLPWVCVCKESGGFASIEEKKRYDDSMYRFTCLKNEHIKAWNMFFKESTQDNFQLLVSTFRSFNSMLMKDTLNFDPGQFLAEQYLKYCKIDNRKREEICTLLKNE